MISTDSSATNNTNTTSPDNKQQAAEVTTASKLVESIKPDNQQQEDNKTTTKNDSETAVKSNKKQTKQSKNITDDSKNAQQSATAPNTSLSSKKNINPYTQNVTSSVAEQQHNSHHSHHHNQQAHHSHHQHHMNHHHLSHHHHHQNPYMNYYPYMPRGAPATTAGSAQATGYPASAHLDQNGAAWPQAIAAAAMAAAMVDPVTLAAYMNGASSGTPGYLANPADLAQYDQFSFGFTPAFGFGYNGSGSIDYHNGSNGANSTQPALWTNNSSSVPPLPTTVTNSSASSSSSTTVSTTNTNTTVSSPPVNSNETNTKTSNTNTSTSTTNNTNTNSGNTTPAKWVQLVQDPLSVQHINDMNYVTAAAVAAAQQLSPVDMYHATNGVNGRHNNSNHYQQHHSQRHLLNYHNHHYSNNNTAANGYSGMFPSAPYYHGGGTNAGQMIHQNNHHHYNNTSKQHHNYNYQLNKIENGINSINVNETKPNEQKQKSTVSSLNTAALPSTSQTTTCLNDGDMQIENESIDSNEATKSFNEQNAELLSKSDSKTWASIVGFSTNTQQPQQISSRSSPSPTLQQQVPQMNYETNFNENGVNKLKGIKSSSNKFSNNNQQQQQTSFDIFDLNNRAFPPISVNSSNDKPEKVEPKTKVATATTALTSTKKQQQYNNYQKQQQQQFSLTGKVNAKSNNVINGETVTNTITSETPKLTSNGSSHYYKRHQPTQPTISSFMTNLDKSLFFNDKSNAEQNTETTSPSTNNESLEPSNVLDLTQLKVYTNPNAYNPKEFNINPKAARFFVIKSYSEDDVHRSIKYNIWCSTEHGNRRLDSAYFKGDSQVPVYLFFSVNGSGHFCGMAEMMSRVDYNKKTDVWSQDKWRGCFQVKWIYVKDVPNSLLRNIKLENNDNKPVTNSRDTQEIPFDKGKQVLKVFHTYSHSSSILDDFDHYERKQEEDTFKSLNHNANFNQIYNHIEYINNHQFIIDQNNSLVAMGNNLILTNNSSNMNNIDRQMLSDSNVIADTTNNTTGIDTNNENTSLVNSSSSSSTMTTTTTATNTTVSSSATSSPMSASSSSSSSASSVSSSDESKEIEINKKEQQHQPAQLVVT